MNRCEYEKVWLDMLEQVLNCILLGVLSICDVRCRRIPAWPCVIYGLTGLVWHGVCSEDRVHFLIIACAVSVLFFVLACMLRRVCGSGDLLTVWACLCMDGSGTVMGIVFLALVLAGLYAAGLLLLRKAGKGDTFPFVPFLLLSQILFLTEEAACKISQSLK